MTDLEVSSAIAGVSVIGRCPGRVSAARAPRPIRVHESILHRGGRPGAENPRKGPPPTAAVFPAPLRAGAPRHDGQSRHVPPKLPRPRAPGALIALPTHFGSVTINEIDTPCTRRSLCHLPIGDVLHVAVRQNLRDPQHPGRRRLRGRRRHGLGASASAGPTPSTATTCSSQGLPIDAKERGPRRYAARREALPADAQRDPPHQHRPPGHDPAGGSQSHPQPGARRRSTATTWPGRRARSWPATSARWPAPPAERDELSQLMVAAAERRRCHGQLEKDFDREFDGVQRGRRRWQEALAPGAQGKRGPAAVLPRRGAARGPQRRLLRLACLQALRQRGRPDRGGAGGRRPVAGHSDDDRGGHRRSRRRIEGSSSTTWIRPSTGRRGSRDAVERQDRFLKLKETEVAKAKQLVEVRTGKINDLKEQLAVFQGKTADNRWPTRPRPNRKSWTGSSTCATRARRTRSWSAKIRRLEGVK